MIRCLNLQTIIVESEQLTLLSVQCAFHCPEVSLRATTNCTTMCRCQMQVWHLVGVTLSIQNLVIPSRSSFLFLGLTTFPKKGLGSCQSSSIGFRDSGSGGGFHQLMPLSMKVVACEPVCFRSLSCWKQCSSEQTSLMKGNSPLYEISET